MRRYYFDFLHNNTLRRDDEGSEHPSEDSARRELHRAMLEISGSAVGSGGAWQLVGVVRDGRSDLWRSRMSFEPAASAEAPRS